MRIAVLGGSFNPVHIGHLALADAARIDLGYDLVLFVPTFISPFKENLVGPSASDRVAMLKLALEDLPWFKVELCELEREGVSYTIDTLQFLSLKYQAKLEGKLGFIIGDDLVSDFYRWKAPDLVAENADLILSRRPISQEQVVFPWKHLRLDNPELDISSSMIRSAIVSGKSWRYLVPPLVYQYIKNHNLYE